MRRLFKLAKEYWLVALVVVAILIGGTLALTGQGSAAKWLLSSFALAVALKLARGMLETLKEGRYGIDILAVTAIVSTVVVGEYWASMVIVLMLTGGEALEDYAANRAQRELNDLMDRAPQTAHKVTKQGTTTIALSKVKVGDILLVKPGEVVPVDAELLEKSAEFDESSLTGESLPVEHKQGEQLMSGSVNGGQAVTIKTLKSAEDSQYQQIIELVKAATGSEAPFVRLADRYAVPFTIISYIIAGMAWAISGDALRFAQVLVVATPCPLLLGAPIALISGMSRAAKHGIIVKSGGVLEQLAVVKAVAFDKTGTLTYGHPEVANMQPQKGFTTKQLLQYAASAEQQSAHILAHSLTEKAAQQKLTLYTPTNVKETTAQGMSATVNKKKVLVGKAGFLQTQRVKVGAAATKSGETAVHVAVDGVYAGSITFTDKLRPESQETVATLRRAGIHEVLMLTGDAQATAARIAQEAGIQDFKAECLPIDKVNAVRDLSLRPVMMVGDGVNDAPVLAVAEVGLAMGARGSTAASETADVVVLVDDISKAAAAVLIAKRTIRIALQSIGIGIAISVVLMLVAASGAIPAVVGAGLQEVVDVVVIFNALRAHSGSA